MNVREKGALGCLHCSPRGALEKPLPHLEGKVRLELEPACAPGLLSDP